MFRVESEELRVEIAQVRGLLRDRVNAYKESAGIRLYDRKL